MKRSESVITQNDDNNRDSNKKKFTNNYWNNSLFNAIKDESLIVSKDETFTIIKDKYPKSRHHLLVVVNEDIFIEEVNSLKRCDIQLIDFMQIKGKQIANQIDINSEFRFGFHCIPSLKPLHMHIISQDFDSKCLKTKKHYNSFTTKFFIDSKTVIENLNNCGKALMNSRKECEEFLKQDIVCHFCRLKIPNIPKLKNHLLIHYPKQ